MESSPRGCPGASCGNSPAERLYAIRSNGIDGCPIARWIRRVSPRRRTLVRDRSDGGLEQRLAPQVACHFEDALPTIGVVLGEGHAECDGEPEVDGGLGTNQGATVGALPAPAIVLLLVSVEADLEHTDAAKHLEALWNERTIGAKCNAQPTFFGTGDHVTNAWMKQRFTTVEANRAGSGGGKIVDELQSASSFHLGGFGRRLVTEGTSKIAPVRGLDIDQEGPRTAQACCEQPCCKAQGIRALSLRPPGSATSRVVHI
jgi:hypothetical protein